MTSATTLVATGRCVARWSRCKVNDGVDLYVAVNVKGLVKVNVEDKVEVSAIGSVFLDRYLFTVGKRRAHERQGTRLRASLTEHAVIDRGNECIAHRRTRTA